MGDIGVFIVTAVEILHKIGWEDAYFFVGIKNYFGMDRHRRNLEVTKPLFFQQF